MGDQQEKGDLRSQGAAVQGSEHFANPYVPNAAAKAASDYFNSLPREQRSKLAPLLDEQRRLGIVEATDTMRAALSSLTDRVRRIRESQTAMAAEDAA